MIHLIKYKVAGTIRSCACGHYLDEDNDDWTTPGAFGVLYEAYPFNDDHPPLCEVCISVFEKADNDSPWTPR